MSILSNLGIHNCNRRQNNIILIKQFSVLLALFLHNCNRDTEIAMIVQTALTIAVPIQTRITMTVFSLKARILGSLLSTRV